MLNNFYIDKHARKNDEHDDETREQREYTPEEETRIRKIHTRTHSPALSLLSPRDRRIRCVVAATFLFFFPKNTTKISSTFARAAAFARDRRATTTQTISLALTHLPRARLALTHATEMMLHPDGRRTIFA